MDCTLDSEHIQYSKFQVNIFSNNRDIKQKKKMSHILYDDNEDVKAIAIPRVFFENSQVN